ncbi:UNVERIFIED_CONTAM: ATP-dependent 6-phosphofructokinase [Sesamum radiatum]|uniref:ATP-dependent 6-phosphofructokinase n=1 Tax=Sesamum radiatum TaxID=300843 RepID=A0AAW2KIF0_SESRA
MSRHVTPTRRARSLPRIKTSAYIAPANAVFFTVNENHGTLTKRRSRRRRRPPCPRSGRRAPPNSEHQVAAPTTPHRLPPRPPNPNESVDKEPFFHPITEFYITPFTMHSFSATSSTTSPRASLLRDPTWPTTEPGQEADILRAGSRAGVHCHLRRAVPRDEHGDQGAGGGAVGVIRNGGTVLETSRGGFDLDKIVNAIENRGFNQVYIIGGDGTMRGMVEIFNEIKRRKLNIAVAGIPKTVDNDVGIIDKSFGFQTAVEMAQQAINAAHTEAESA